MHGKTEVPETAILLVGGEGTRLRPRTLEIPKPLLPVNGKPVIEHIIEELSRHGVTRVVLSLGYKADKIVRHFAEKEHMVNGVRIEHIIEEKPLGTGGALKFAFSKLHGVNDVLVLNGDNIFDIDFAEMYSLHKRRNSLVTIALVDVDDVTGFGVVLTDGEVVTDFVEKPDPAKAKSKTINSGIYLVSAEAIRQFPDQEVFSFERDFLQKMAPTGKISAFKMRLFLTFNTEEQYQHVQREMASRTRP